MTEKPDGDFPKSVNSFELRALKFLARGGAGAFPDDMGNERAVVRIAQTGGDSNRRIAHMELAGLSWMRWVTAGWVVRDDETGDGRWHMSNVGRQQLKRMLSRTSESEMTPVCTTSQPRAAILAGQCGPSADRTASPNATPSLDKPSVKFVGTLSQNDAESPLAWLRKRKGRDGQQFISEAEFIAGERLRADFWFAQMTPSVTANWSPVVSGKRPRSGANREADQADAISDAAERVRAALKAVGPELSGVLVDVCCHLRGIEVVEKSSGWPQRSGKIVLRMALAALARHYGWLRDQQHAGDGCEAAVDGVKVRHWAADDYRPNASRW